MNERKRVAERTAGRYRRARKKEKTVILNEFVELTGYTRSYARLVLRNHGRVVAVSNKLHVRGEVGRWQRRARSSYYDEKVKKLLVIVWRIMDYICGKRLAPVLGEMVDLLERRGEIKCDAETKKKLGQMSAATIDRLLRPARQKSQLKGRGHTKPDGFRAGRGAGANYPFLTQKERDVETGLDYFLARYYSSTQGRFTSADPLGGHIRNPQSLNKYAYVINNPLRLKDPTGMYVCEASKKCDSKEDKEFEKARQRNLKSKNPDVVRGAKAYGNPNENNGVTVKFGDPGDGKAGNTTHELELDPNDPNKTKFRAKETVVIRSGLSGVDLDTAVGHEGSHVADAQEFVSTIDENTGWFDLSKNLTKYQTEVRAYMVTHSILASGNEYRDFGRCGLDPCRLGAGEMPAKVKQAINGILEKPTYGVTESSPGPLLYPELTTPNKP